jgi:hypothetical protein
MCCSLPRTVVASAALHHPALDAHHPSISSKERASASRQCLGARFTNHYSAVGRVANSERKLRRQIRSDDRRDHIRGRSLCRDDHVDASRSAFLSEADQTFLNRLAVNRYSGGIGVLVENEQAPG